MNLFKKKPKTDIGKMYDGKLITEETKPSGNEFIDDVEGWVKSLQEWVPQSKLAKRVKKSTKGNVIIDEKGYVIVKKFDFKSKKPYWEYDFRERLPENYEQLSLIVDVEKEYYGASIISIIYEK